MIELDQTTRHYVEAFDHLKSPPTHAELVMLSWALHGNAESIPDKSFSTALKPHIMVIYAYGKIVDGAFEADVKILPMQSQVDMRQYDTEVQFNSLDEKIDTPETLRAKAYLERGHAIRDSLITASVGPHPDDPATHRPIPAKRKNRFSEEDLDIVFAHIEPRVHGKAVAAV